MKWVWKQKNQELIPSIKHKIKRIVTLSETVTTISYNLDFICSLWELCLYTAHTPLEVTLIKEKGKLNNIWDSSDGQSGEFGVELVVVVVFT